MCFRFLQVVTSFVRTGQVPHRRSVPLERVQATGDQTAKPA
jgi:hypothetical protein